MLERRREAATGYKEKLSNELIAAHQSRSLAIKNGVYNFIRNWVLDHFPIILHTIQPSKQILKSSVSLSVKRRLKDDGEEEDENEAYSRWATQWIEALVLERDKTQAFQAATRDIAFLAQIEVSFNFSSTSNLENNIRENEEE